MPLRSPSVAFLLLLISVSVRTAAGFSAQVLPYTDQVQTSPPPIRGVEPPAPDATADALERQGDDLRAHKLYLDAVDYYRAALVKKPHASALYNKMGIAQLLMQRWVDAKKSFEHAIKQDHDYADAYNNLGVIFYIGKKYGKAIDRYNQAIRLKDDAASYYSNLGAALFSKKQFDQSVLAYSHALQLDPDVFERISRAGVAAQMAKPEDRAHYDYVVAKLYAKMGVTDRSLEYLRRAMEEGYKSIDNVYKDEEFAGLRKDPRFTELMTARPPGISD
ncbi:MAG TPA: tetratricopeptide repeat protein [Terriglobales bacterium]|nr:tetratricopeptide repeat protein [Terriglobales bacterium]